MPDQSRFERALFVLGKQNAGKSTRIRNMYEDVRMGRNGVVPQKTVRSFPVVYLSQERRLYVRVQSPEEAGETLAEFFTKIENAIERDGPRRRWNSVIAVQFDEGRNIEDGIDVAKRFINKYHPERVRIAIVNPPARPSAVITDYELATLLDRIRELRSPKDEDMIVEAMQIEGRGRNGLLLTDFFDFS